MAQDPAARDEEDTRLFDARFRWLLWQRLAPLRKFAGIDLDDDEQMERAYAWLAELVREKARVNGKIVESLTPEAVQGLIEETWLDIIAKELVSSSNGGDQEGAPEGDPQGS
jgi:hypothetical protein